MMVLLILALLVAAAALCIRRYIRSKRCPPRPRNVQFSFFTGNMSFFTPPEEFAARLRVLGNEERVCMLTFGPIFYPLLELIVISDPTLTEELFTRHANKFLQSSALVSQFGKCVAWDSVLIKDGPDWKRLNNVMMQFYTVKNLKYLAEKMRSNIDIFITQCPVGESVIVMPMLIALTLDIIADVAFSHDLQMQTHPDGELSKNLLTIFRTLADNTFSPRIVVSAEHKKALASVNALLEKLFTTRLLDREDDVHDFMSLFVRSFENKEMSKIEVLANLLSVLLGGFETTSNTVGFLLADLAVFPEIQERLYDELSLVCEDRLFPSFEDLSKLPYLDAVMRESQRVHPVGFATGRTVVSDVLLTDGTFIPKGAHFMINTIGMSNAERNVRDPFSFDPERFLQEDAPSSWTSMPFGCGQHSCQGKKLAVMETKLITSRIVQSFRVKPAGPCSSRTVFTLCPSTIITFERREI
jgi:cytochrome P450